MTPTADGRHLLIVTEDRAGALVVAIDAHAGRRLRCPCGHEAWTAFGHYARHARGCPNALTAGLEARLRERAALRLALETIAAGAGKDAALARAVLERTGP